MTPLVDAAWAEQGALDRSDTTAPAQSTVFNQVLLVAERSGVDRNALARLLWLLNAHPRLLGHRQCMQNLRGLFSTPEFVETAQDWASAWIEDIPAWVAAADWATHQAGDPWPAPKEFNLEPRHERHHVLMRHGISRHPVAGALWIRHHLDMDPSVPTASCAAPSRTFRLLQWHLFCSQAEARFSHSTLEQYLEYDLPREWPAWPRPAAAVGLALRQFSYSGWDALLDDFPFKTRLEDFAEALVAGREHLEEKHGSGAGWQRIVALISYFEDFKLFFDGTPLRQRRRGGGGSGGGRTGIPGFIHFLSSPRVYFEPPEAPTGDEDVPSLDITRVHIHSEDLTPELTAELETLGIAPVEDLQPIMDLLPIEDRPGGIHGLWIQRRGAESAAQRHAWDKTQLTPFEVRAFLDVIDGLRERPESKSSGTEDQAARLTLQCMLLFGCAVEDVQTIRTMLSTDLDAQAAGDGGLATRVVLINPKTDQCVGFALPAISPRYASCLPDAFTETAHAAKPWLWLPDVSGVGAALLQHQRNGASTIGGRVFNESQALLEDQIKLLMEIANRRLDAQSRPRLTTTKVARKLPSLLSRAGVDEVGVALLCGDRRYERQARLHYTQHQEDDLVRSYTKAVQRMLREARYPIEHGYPTQAPVGQGVQGARLVVKQDKLQGFIQTLRNELEAAPTFTRSGRHRYHRAILLYSLVMQGLVTATRPSNQPDRLLAQLLAHGGTPDRKAFIVSVAEKDNQYESRARAVTVPAVLRQQFDHLLEHGMATWRWRPVGLIVPSFTQAQHAFLDWPDDRTKPRAHVIGAQWLARQLAHFGLPAAANFTRAFVRTWLLRNGCREQTIDAFLGHAMFGQSPTAMHGTLDFAHQLCEVSNCLDQMIEDLGLHPVRSRLAATETGLSETHRNAA